MTANVNMTFLGLISLQGKLLPMKKSNGGPQFKYICPDCTEPTKVAQQYTCPEHADHGPYTTKDLDRALEVEKGVLKRVTDDQITEVKEPTLPTGEATFEVFPAEQVEAATVPSGSVYRVRPTSGVVPYLMLVELLKGQDTAWICELALKGVQKMYRCVSRDGMLTLTELVRPSELNPAETVDGEFPEESLDMARQAVKGQVADFDPEAFASRTRERTAELVAQLDESPSAKKKAAPKKKPSETDALLAALQQSIDATGKPKRKKAS